jgi:hypothetical protein
MGKSLLVRGPAALALVAVAVGVSLATIGLVACSGTSSVGTSSFEPAVVVRGSEVARGLGCGAGPTQVLQYAAIATRASATGATTAGAPEEIVGGGVFDCYADATFLRLPSTLVNQALDIDVYLYNQVAVSSGAFQAQRDALRVVPPSRVALEGAQPTWRSRCRVTYLPDVVTYASCDAATVASAAGADAGADAGSGASVEVKLEGLTRAAAVSGAPGAPFSCGTDFAQARATFTARGTAGETTGALDATLCAEGLRVSSAVAPASYVLTVELLGVTGTVVGRTLCRASTSPNVATAAVCEPVRPAATAPDAGTDAGLDGGT